jgi:hypothetical protein
VILSDWELWGMCQRDVEAARRRCFDVRGQTCEQVAGRADLDGAHCWLLIFDGIDQMLAKPEGALHQCRFLQPEPQPLSVGKRVYALAEGSGDGVGPPRSLVAGVGEAVQQPSGAQQLAARKCGGWGNLCGLATRRQRPAALSPHGRLAPKGGARCRRERLRRPKSKDLKA